MEIYGGLASTQDRFQMMMERNGRRVKWRRQTSHLNDHHRSCHKFHNTESIYRRSSGNPPYHKESVAFMVVGLQSGKTSTHSMGKRKKGKQSLSESISVHNDPSEVQQTWHFNQWFSRHHSHLMSFGFSSACANCHRIDGNSTLICSKIKPELGSINIRDGYINMGLRSVLITVSFQRADSPLVNKRISGWSKKSAARMDASGCRNDAANQDLLEARQGYETRAAARNKRKVEELEAQVKQAEDGRTVEEISAEVDWLRDPGTPSKRATQFVRTKAESWKTKMLIAKALETMEKEKQNTVTGVIVTDEQFRKIINYNSTLEERINTIHEVVQVVNRKLALLIQILRDTVNAAPGTSQPAKTGAEENETLEAMQARMNTHMRHIRLDTVSQMGKFI